jgi:hypothetical protein
MSIFLAAAGALVLLSACINHPLGRPPAGVYSVILSSDRTAYRTGEGMELDARIAAVMGERNRKGIRVRELPVRGNVLASGSLNVTLAG